MNGSEYSIVTLHIQRYPLSHTLINILYESHGRLEFRSVSGMRRSECIHTYLFGCMNDKYWIESKEHFVRVISHEYIEVNQCDDWTMRLLNIHGCCEALHEVCKIRSNKCHLQLPLRVLTTQDLCAKARQAMTSSKQANWLSIPKESKSNNTISESWYRGLRAPTLLTNLPIRILQCNNTFSCCYCCWNWNVVEIDWFICNAHCPTGLSRPHSSFESPKSIPCQFPVRYRKIDSSMITINFISHLLVASNTASIACFRVLELVSSSGWREVHQWL